MDLEHERRLTELENRSKSNTHRIDKLEASTEAIGRLATSMEVMVAEQKHQTEAMTGIKADVAKQRRSAATSSTFDAMEVPKNCRECMFTYHCASWYGGSTCKYRKEINRHDH